MPMTISSHKILANYVPGGSSDPYREYWNGTNYTRRWTGINMSGQRIEHVATWTVKEQRKGGVWFVHQKWKEGRETFAAMLREYKK